MMRKFLIDVNVPKDVWSLLKQEGFFYKCLHDIDREMKDIEVVKSALKENYILITCDKDFAYLQPIFSKLDVIIFDSRTQETKNKVNVLRQVLKLIKENPELEIKCTLLRC